MTPILIPESIGALKNSYVGGLCANELPWNPPAVRGYGPSKDGLYWVYTPNGNWFNSIAFDWWQMALDKESDPIHGPLLTPKQLAELLAAHPLPKTAAVDSQPSLEVASTEGTAGVPAVPAKELAALKSDPTDAEKRMREMLKAYVIEEIDIKEEYSVFRTFDSLISAHHAQLAAKSTTRDAKLIEIAGRAIKCFTESRDPWQAIVDWNRAIKMPADAPRPMGPKARELLKTYRTCFSMPSLAVIEALAEAGYDVAAQITP